jgi:hypothetical protein
MKKRFLHLSTLSTNLLKVMKKTKIKLALAKENSQIEIIENSFAPESVQIEQVVKQEPIQSETGEQKIKNTPLTWS